MIILFDVETTGADEGAEIIEAAVGVLVGEPGSAIRPAISAVAVERFKPSKPIELGALSTHHIIASDLENCPPSSTFALPEGVKLLIGHNIDFDWKMAGSPLIHRICTEALARSVWPTLDSYKLGSLLYHLLSHDEARLRLTTAHTAETDVYNVFILLEALLDQLKPDSWKQLYRMSEEARVPKFITFGKHKPAPGEPPKPFSDVPRDYRDWILRQPDMDEYVKIAVRRSLGMAE
jgi:exodeoxyribonuclease X